MDLILGRFFETHHATWEDHFLDLLESLLEENDHDIYAWLTGNSEPPGQFDPLLALVRAKNLINL